MRAVLRLFAVFLFFIITTIAWMTLGGVMNSRTSQQSGDLLGQVHDLWGADQQQDAPQLAFTWISYTQQEQALTDEKGNAVRDRSGVPIRTTRLVAQDHVVPMALNQTDITADLRLNQRRKGLLWYALYDVDFDGRWAYTHTNDEPGLLRFSFAFPSGAGLFDDFVFTVNGEEVPHAVDATGGRLQYNVPVSPGNEVSFGVRYTSRGMDSWTYRPVQNTGQIDTFNLHMTTDFASIDFPA